jgi:hypothetical protein
MTTPAPADDEIAAAIEALLASRRAEASICPSEAARVLRPEGWRALMPAVRQVAWDMARAGRLRITQGSVTIDIAHADRVQDLPGTPAALRGAIRLRRPLPPAR